MTTQDEDFMDIEDVTISRLERRIRDLEARAAFADEMAEGLYSETLTLFGPSIWKANNPTSKPEAYWRDWLARYRALPSTTKEGQA